MIQTTDRVQFQGVPRRVLDLLLPSKTGAPNSTAVLSKPSNATGKEPIHQLGGDLTLTRSQAPVRKAPTSTLTKSPAKSVKTSSDSTFPRVRAIISEELGIDVSELNSENEFSEYGLDSLLSLTVSGRLREELGIEAPVTMFADYPTVGELQSFVEGDKIPPLSPSSSSDEEPEVWTPETVPQKSMENFIEILRNTISEETGISIQELTPSATLSELGVDSLLALTAIGRLNEVLEIELPQSLFTDSGTLNELELALGSRIKDHYLGTGSNFGTNQALSCGNDVDLPPHATSILIQGNPKTASKKLFLFPDGSGSATSYASLQSVSPDIAIYGLNCPWVKTPENMTCTLEGLTAKYILEIRKRQSHGPYFFGGWSAGGICAYEAAWQLSRSGEETARLILLDSPNPIGLENPPQRMYDFFESLGIFGMEGKAPPPWLRKHFDAFIRLLDDYKVAPLSGGPLKTHLVYARDGICKLPTDPRPEIRPDDPREMIWLLNNRTDFSGSGWLKLVGVINLKIEVLDDVNHFTMMEAGPKSAELAAFIRRAME
jgi:naphtho-gamma-pyrone polyketide synthase